MGEFGPRDRHLQREGPVNTQGGDYGQGIPEPIKGQPGAEVGSHVQLSEGTNPVNTLTLNTHNRETIHFCWLSHPVYNTLLQQPQETSIVVLLCLT